MWVLLRGLVLNAVFRVISRAEEEGERESVVVFPIVLCLFNVVPLVYLWSVIGISWSNSPAFSLSEEVK